MKEILGPYVEGVERKIAACVGSFGRLEEVCAYALQNGGKRFRPILVELVAKGVGEADVSDGAFAVECFHTASLIADDLPCMDDEVERRGKPPVHKVFGEANALLATYALIAEGYDRIRANAGSGEVLEKAVACACRTTGVLGATGGQFVDLDPPELNEGIVREAIRMKTGALFELSFVLGWLFGGGALEKLGLVENVAHHFGMAFQVVDDLGDLEEDMACDRKISYPRVCGVERSMEVIKGELRGVREGLEQLQAISPELLQMAAYLEASAGAFGAGASS